MVPPVPPAAARRKTFMYSTLEKTIILKSAVLFSAIAAETLSRVAQMAEEVSFGAGSPVYREGEPGSALYVVASGAVRIMAGARELAVLRRGDPFGEIAVLNRDVYRASVTAIEDSVLLRIDQEDMFELMQSNTEILQGIIGLLVGRVLQVGDLLRRPDSTGA
jgi:CRP-like cAMP-binding protein